MLKTNFKFWRRTFLAVAISAQSQVFAANSGSGSEYPFVFHLIQAALWDEAIASDRTYFPPTYSQDGFTHGTANPDKLLTVANHFYQQTEGDWYCLRMTTESLRASGVTVVFESTAPVGDQLPDFEGSEDELYPHIMGGISAGAVLEVLPVERGEAGEFLRIQGLYPQE